MYLSSVLMVLTGSEVSEFGGIETHFAFLNRGVFVVLSCGSLVFVLASDLFCNTDSESDRAGSSKVLATA